MTATPATDVRTRRREQTRREILDAAWRLAEEHGIAGLSLRDLAAAVGMRAPSLYTYFDRKGAIYDEMFAAGYRELMAVTREIEPDPDDPVGTLATAAETFVDFCRASIPRYQLMFTRAVPDWEPSPEAYQVSLTHFAAVTERMAALGVTEQEDLDLYTALVSGLASQQLANDPHGDRWRRLAHHAAAMFVAHVNERPERS